MEETQDYEFQLYININEVRMLYNHVNYAIETWPGSPARPPEEQEYLKQLKTQLFAMISDYTFEYG